MHPFQGFPFDLADGFPRAEVLDDFGLEQSDDAFCGGVVAAVADASNRHVDAGFAKPFGTTDRMTLHASVRMMDQAALRGLSAADGLVEDIKHGHGSYFWVKRLQRGKPSNRGSRPSACFRGNI